MNPTISAFDWASLAPALPVLTLLAVALGLVALDLFLPRERALLPWLTVLGAAAVLLMLPGLGLPLKARGSDMLAADGYAGFFGALCLASVILTALMRELFSRETRFHRGEFYSLLVFSAMGMLIMAAAADLMCLYLGIELMALPLYVLIGIHRREGRAVEAAAKYFLTGVFASSIMLFGISLLFGLAGSTSLAAIGAAVVEHDLARNPALLAALCLVLAGLCFKVAAAPFHMWTPDVYEGSPAVLTAFLSVGPKAAAFAAFGRVMFTAFPALVADWAPLLATLAVFTMLAGNVTALVQDSLKRMLAYSAVAHAGYTLLGLAAGTPQGLAAAMSYLGIYLFMNTGAFAVLILVSRGRESGENLAACRGLARREPLLALAMLIFMFSLTGIPPTGGFTGKFALFQAALSAGYLHAVVIAVLLSAVSAFFYLRVVRLMYMEAPEADGGAGQGDDAAPDAAFKVVLALTAAGTLLLGLLPGPLFDWARAAAGTMMLP